MECEPLKRQSTSKFLKFAVETFSLTYLNAQWSVGVTAGNFPLNPRWITDRDRPLLSIFLSQNYPRREIVIITIVVVVIIICFSNSKINGLVYDLKRKLIHCCMKCTLFHVRCSGSRCSPLDWPCFKIIILKEINYVRMCSCSLRGSLTICNAP